MKKSRVYVEYLRQGFIEMIKFKLEDLMNKKGSIEKRVVTINEVSNNTGIHRSTLSKILNEDGYNTGTDNIEKLCKFFDCAIEDVIEYIKD